MEQVSYADTCIQAMQGILDMFFQVENPLDGFKKDTYEARFQSYFRKHAGAIDAMEAVYRAQEQPEDWCRKLAEHLTDEAEKHLQGISRKSKRDQQQMNYNMVLAIYVFPALMETKRESTEAIADAIVQVWNRRFQTSVGKSTFDKIHEGFHKKLCYITTAVCESLGKEDDCYELSLLRNYRDTYLMSTKEGRELVEEYYNIAPTIVTRINKTENAADLYQDIWNIYLKPCIQCIEENRKEECQTRYMEMVMELKGRYIA